jgi:hypothetical protein
MSITYTWTFAPFRVRPLVGALVNVVKEVPYTLSATDGVNTFAVGGSIALGQPDAKNFIPFASLTAQNAIDWCSAVLDVPAIQANLAVALAAAPVPAPALITLTPAFEAQQLQALPAQVVLT